MPVLNVNEARALRALYEDPADHGDPRRNILYGARPAKVSDYMFAKHITQQLSSSDRVEDFSSFKHGVENPRWREQVLRHVDAGTAYRVEGHKVSAMRRAYMTWTAKKSLGGDGTPSYCDWGTLHYAGHTTCPFPVTTVTASVDSWARQDLFDKLNPAFHGATFIGELAETVSMLRRPYRHVHDALLLLTNRNRKRRLQIVRKYKLKKRKSQDAAEKKYREVASAAWLETRFALMPFMSDIEGIFKTLTKLLDESPVIRYTGSSSQTFKTTRSVKDESGIFYNWADLLVEGVHTTSVKYSVGVLNSVASDRDYAEELAVAPLDWLPTAWELLPYSWAVDYFANIGDILNAFVTQSRVKYSYVSKTVKHESTYNVTLTPAPFQEWLLPYVLSREDITGFVAVKKKRVERTVEKLVSLPDMTISNRLSPFRVVNLVALAHMKGEGARFYRKYLR